MQSCSPFPNVKNFHCIKSYELFKIHIIHNPYNEWLRINDEEFEATLIAKKIRKYPDQMY